MLILGRIFKIKDFKAKEGIKYYNHLFRGRRSEAQEYITIISSNFKNLYDKKFAGNQKHCLKICRELFDFLYGHLVKPLNKE